MPGSPLGTIETILAQHGIKSGDLAYDSLQYYADVSDSHLIQIMAAVSMRDSHKATR